MPIPQIYMSSSFAELVDLNKLYSTPAMSSLGQALSRLVDLNSILIQFLVDLIKESSSFAELVDLNHRNYLE